MSLESQTPEQISNLEVMELLQKRLAERTKKHKRSKHRDWIEEKVVEYIKRTPCTRLDPSRRKEMLTVLQSSKRAPGKTTGFGLTEAESLQIANCMPTEPVEIHLMIEELQARMTERQQDELLEFVSSYTKDKSPDSSKDTSGSNEDGAAVTDVQQTAVKWEDLAHNGSAGEDRLETVDI